MPTMSSTGSKLFNGHMIAAKIKIEDFCLLGCNGMQSTEHQSTALALHPRGQNSS
jgi:hypothetical protein